MGVISSACYVDLTLKEGPFLFVCGVIMEIVSWIYPEAKKSVDHFLVLPGGGEEEGGGARVEAFAGGGL